MLYFFKFAQKLKQRKNIPDNCMYNLKVKLISYCEFSCGLKKFWD